MYVKNYCKVKVEPHSILPTDYQINDGLWFIATQDTHNHYTLPSEAKGDSNCKPTNRYSQNKHVLYCYKWLSNLIALLP